MSQPILPQRRRIYLMRHGHVDYFKEGASHVDQINITLSENGRLQAVAAGNLFKKQNIQFNRVITSALPRTQETAQLVLKTCAQTHLKIETEKSWNEIHVDFAHLESFSKNQKENNLPFSPNPKFTEQLFNRLLPQLNILLADNSWQTALIVLHGGVNIALLSYFISGSAKNYFYYLDQSPACINIIDIGKETSDTIIRTINFSPTQELFPNDRHSILEKLMLEKQKAKE